MVSLEVLPDDHSLSRALAERFVQSAMKAIAGEGRFSVALAGGSTPRAAYALLASAPYAGRLDWSCIHLFWGDERCVPPEHPHSNYRMASQVLLEQVPIPPGNVHRMRGEAPPTQAAAEYQEILRRFFDPQSTNGDLPLFDLLLLGMGEDGHVASLFPGSPALQVTDRWVVAVEHHQPPPPLVIRLSLTLPAINAAREVVFAVAGESKAARLKQVLSPGSSEVALPAQLVRPRSGRLLWLVEQAAAKNIDTRS